jgi:cytosine/adenosine deaminase-related metal-dependent hydrolase
MDAKLGDFEKADVLIEGSKIAAVGPNLEASADVIDASDMIVMPGFVDSHRHIWQGQLRNILPNGRLDPDTFATSVLHATCTGQLLPLAKLMGPDCTYIHCCRLTPDEWKLIADSGGGVSLASAVEMEMGHGVPPFQQTLDLKIPLSLSNDVETEVPSEFFTQMRNALFLQRMLVFSRERAGEKNTPPLMSVKQVVEIATMGGAKVNHLEKKTGSLTPGKQADVVMLTANAINVMPLNHAYGAVVLGMDTSNVDTVFVGGKVRKWKGQLVGVKLDELRRTSEQSRDWLLAQAKWPKTVLGGYLPGH